MTPGFGQKVNKSFVAYLYPQLTLSPPDKMMGQSFLDYLNLLHIQGGTLEDAGKSGLVQNEQEFGMVSAADRLGNGKYCKLGKGAFACI